MEDEMRNKEEEYDEMVQQIQSLQQEKEKYVSYALWGSR
jgi:fructose-1,6-bisphosphatase